MESESNEKILSDNLQLISKFNYQYGLRDLLTQLLELYEKDESISIITDFYLRAWEELRALEDPDYTSRSYLERKISRYENKIQEQYRKIRKIKMESMLSIKARKDNVVYLSKEASHA